MIKVEAVVIRERVETVSTRSRNRQGTSGHSGRGDRPRPPARISPSTAGASSSRGPAEGAASRSWSRTRSQVQSSMRSPRCPSGGESGDGSSGRLRSRTSRTTHRDEARGGGTRMTTKDLMIATSTVWVIVAAILVMFMQAGFAFLEAGLTRMKNRGTLLPRRPGPRYRIARLLPVRLRDRVRRRWNGLVGGGSVRALVRDAARDRRLPFSWFASIPAGAATSSRSSSRPSRSRSSGAPWPNGPSLRLLRLRRRLHARLLGRLALDLAPGRLVVRPRDAGLRRLDRRSLPGALAALAGAILLGPRIGVRPGREAERDPGPQHGVRDARRVDPLVRLVRFNPGSTLGVVTGPDRLLRLRRIDDDTSRAAGAIGAVTVAWIVFEEARPVDDAERRHRGIGCRDRSGRFVAPVGRDHHRSRCGRIAVSGVLRVERIRIDDPIGPSPSTVCRSLGNARNPDLRGAGTGREPGHRSGRALVHGQLPPP